MKWLILFPFLPLKWAWKWSSGAKVKFSNGAEESNVFAHVLGFLIISVALYGLIGSAIMKILSICGVGA